MDHWKRTLYVIWFGETVAIAGFMFAIPFLPLYIQELGITGVRKISLWAGLLGTAPAITLVISAPFWGSVADRIGRKPMLQRAMASGCIIIFLMGFARNVQQLLLLRLLQGFFTGTIYSANALVSSIVPRDRYGYGLGLLQTGIMVGTAMGPWVGGIVSDNLGYRNSFFLSALLLGLAALTITLYVQEKFIPAPCRKAQRSRPVNLRVFLAGESPVFSALILLFFIHLSTTIIAPILPLFVQKIAGSGVSPASMTGAILGLGSLAGMISAIVLGRISDRVGYRRILVPCVLSAAFFCSLQALARTPFQLLWTRVCLGLSAGGIVPVVNTIISTRTSPESLGKMFGVAGAVSSSGSGTGPIVGGALASLFSVRSPFLFSGLSLFLTGILAWATTRDRHREPSCATAAESPS